MHKFYFRLQRVLEYRELQEGWAKDALLAAKAARVKAEKQRAELEARRRRGLRSHAPTLESMRNLELYLARLEDEANQQDALIEILLQDETKAHAEWLEARKNRKALAKLREAAEKEWMKAADAEEQKGIDDWATTRRAA